MMLSLRFQGRNVSCFWILGYDGIFAYKSLIHILIKGLTNKWFQIVFVGFVPNIYES